MIDVIQFAKYSSKKAITSIESVVHQYWCILTPRDPIMQSYESLMGLPLIQYWILDSQPANGLLKIVAVYIYFYVDWKSNLA